MAKAAKIMNELVWDCTIEDYAFETACSGTVDATKYIANKDTFKSKSCNDTVEAKKLLKAWWDEAKKQDLDADQKYRLKLNTLVLMEVGQTSVYEVANPNACECGQNVNCIAYLCQTASTPVEDIPERACTAEDGMNGDLEAIATNMHNYYRRLSATGWAKDAKDDYAPLAKAMPALKYDCTTGADKIAQKTKALVTDCPTSVTPNIAGHAANYYLSTHDKPREEVLQETIKSWAEQVSTVGVGKDNIFKDGAAYTQYANMLNDKAETFACAVATCAKNGKSAAACQYNVQPTDDDPIYVVGKQPCKCTAPLTCSKLGGLCVTP
ncbi:SCP-like protein [Ancylostoma duodenale]|uniref:SCP-like protein n=1 Tax=Ancylostoma duodenale TaxID=51022 RepID=A0A0C2CL68_9BILA|nr:SCP-like protein [Ancylostoma duodenale]